ncbi:transcriptional regulator [Streptomyces sp. CT34]|uniref:transcriptional regulator n=1 Tax=Streptomyces sp. CT34 TaxID=1553907 RepID=UPI00068F7032|nr:transcriptional regulator [Streptomyces sp. CT34]
MPEKRRSLSEIERNFHTGPFSETLRTAIANSGLSLHRISRKLAERGANVSPAALSYWQRGSNRPERAESLRAVALLEEILELTPHTLMPLLGPPRSRGRWTASSTPLPTGAVWSRSGSLNRTLTSLGPQALRSLWSVSTLYTHLHERFTADRTPHRTHVRKAVRAEEDGVDRIIAVMHNEGAATHFEAVRAVRLGRIRTDPETHYCVAEFILDRVLNTGDTATVEYVSHSAPGTSPAQQCTRHSLYRPASALVIEVEFAPDAIPVTCEAFYTPRRDAPERRLGPLWIGNGNSAHLALSDPGPGTYGVRWDWD